MADSWCGSISAAKVTSASLKSAPAPGSEPGAAPAEVSLLLVAFWPAPASWDSVLA